jgi:hypothetical protein
MPQADGPPCTQIRVPPSYRYGMEFTRFPTGPKPKGPSANKLPICIPLTHRSPLQFSLRVAGERKLEPVTYLRRGLNAIRELP